MVRSGSRQLRMTEAQHEGMIISGGATMTRPEAVQLDAAHELLERLAGEHGLSHLRHGDEFGEIVADVAE